MGDTTSIEWTEATWNPILGCTKVSPGCDHCYAERIVERFHGKGSFADVRLNEAKLNLPLTWKRPRRVFVNSMSDLFHEGVPDDFIVDVFARMWWSPRHTFQVLTKRHARMRSLMPKVEEALRQIAGDLTLVDAPTPLTWPLPNVWLGVSVEDQKWADIRIRHLLETPAAVRWLSCEPLLGPLNLQRYLSGIAYSSTAMGRGVGGQMFTSGPGLDWVVVGGESGPGARPMHPQWLRSLRDQCEAAGVPHFLKQRGEWTWDMTGSECRPPQAWVCTDGRVGDEATAVADGGEWQGIWRVGKKRAGRLLDGELHDAYPAAVS